MASPSCVLPRVTVQPSFFEIVSEIKQGSSFSAEDAWVSVYEDGKVSVHGKVRIVEGDEPGTVVLESRDGVEVKQLNNTSLSVSCPALNVDSIPVLFPLIIPFSLRGGIQVFDISPKGDLAVVGGPDGLVRVVDTKGVKRAVELKGHVGDVRDVAFFPSGEVVLTCSSDMSLRVFSAKDGSNPRVLTGHTKAVTSLAILDIGKVVCSSSLDGTIRLWRLSDSSTVDTIRLSQPILSMTVGQLPALKHQVEEGAGSFDDVPPHLFAVATHPNGTASIVAISKQHRIARSLSSSSSSPILAVALHSSSSSTSQLIATGSRDGTISIFSFSLQSTTALEEEGDVQKPVLTFKRSSAPITSLQFSASPQPPSSTPSSTSILVGSEDGLPFRAKLPPLPLTNSNDESLSSLSLVEEYGGGIDCDSTTVKEVSGSVWVAAKDGKLRKLS